MATITREIRHGQDVFTLIFDDALQRLTGVHIETTKPYVLEIMNGALVERSIDIPPGVIDRTFTGNQRKPYTLTQSVSALGVRMEVDGVTPKRFINLPHRIRGA